MPRAAKHLLIVSVALGVGALIVTRVAVSWWASPAIYTRADDVPARAVAIVFGAGVRNQQPSAVLYDRVAAAARLYHAGAVQQLLMSGDGRFAARNEPEVMRQTAMRLGVPSEAILVDPAGYSTYDTCARAHAVFGVQSAVLVTQAFHLDRALMLCRGVGISDAVGLAADARPYRSILWFQVREVPATLNALLQLSVSRLRAQF